MRFSRRWSGYTVVGAVVLLVAAACVPPANTPPDTLFSLSVRAPNSTELLSTPAFSPSIHDYVLRCQPGNNVFRVRWTSPGGGTAQITKPVPSAAASSGNVRVVLQENQAVVVSATTATGLTSQYWTRCLPHDFPAITTVRTGATAPGWYLTGNGVIGEGSGGYAMVLDRNGTPVWYRSAPSGAFNVTRISSSAIAYIDGQEAAPGADPSSYAFQVYDLTTHQTSRVSTVGAVTDLHELESLANGDFMLMSYPLVAGVDLTGLPGFGSDETMVDCLLQEVNPAGGLVWQWRASDHIDPVGQSTFPTHPTIDGQVVADVYHCNSIEATPDGNVMVSARHLDSVFLISKATGTLIWKMGGKPFAADGAKYLQVTGDPQVQFYRQHDARLLANGHVTLFDDATQKNGPARAVEYSLDLAAGTATMVWEAKGTVPSGFMGSTRREDDGATVIGWGGGQPDDRFDLFTEVDAQGAPLLSTTFAPGNMAYRVIKEPLSAFDVNGLRLSAGLP